MRTYFIGEIMNFNECIFAGRLTRDPEIKEVNGTNVVTWTVATNRSFTKKSGEKAEKSLFMDCELWGPAAQIVADRGVKGTTILVRGPLEQDNWEDKEGNKRTRFRVRVEFFQFGQNAVKPEFAPADAGSRTSDGDEDFGNSPF
jgi:single-strand DNA-binding protein